MFLTLYNSIQSHNHAITSADFNDTERIVFHEAIFGVYPKETAAKFDWSPAYVYSTRTRIRRKLDLPQEMTFRAWKALNPDLALSLFGTNEITDSKTNSDAD
jgi:DNA-binding CsgD family transcriptional regulator